MTHIASSSSTFSRRAWLRQLGLSSAVLPFLPPIHQLRAQDSAPARPPQRIIFFFSPNGTLPEAFWSPQAGEGDAFELKPILKPLEPFKNRLMTLKGIANHVRGDGDNHMRGMSCLLTGIELLKGNIQGGSATPAGWASGLSIDQELKNFLQSQAHTKTRFGSLEVGVGVPNRADPWTRWTYAGPNQPLAPLSNPYDIFDKLYGQVKDRESLASVLDEVTVDLNTLRQHCRPEEKTLLDQHATFVREMEVSLQQNATQTLRDAAPVLPAGLSTENDQIPDVMTKQTDLLVNAMANDLCRVSTYQFTCSVGQARPKWLGIEDNHHALSHDPDLNAESQEKLLKINIWISQQLAYLAQQLDARPEPGHSGTMLDHTTIVCTNELGKGNSHSMEDIPFVLLGGGLGFKMNRALQYNNIPHNRLWLSLAHAMGHPISTFGNPSLCTDGPLALS
jgi:hypothetical protein